MTLRRAQYRTLYDFTVLTCDGCPAGLTEHVWLGYLDTDNPRAVASALEKARRDVRGIGDHSWLVLDNGKALCWPCQREGKKLDAQGRVVAVKKT